MNVLKITRRRRMLIRAAVHLVLAGQLLLLGCSGETATEKQAEPSRESDQYYQDLFESYAVDGNRSQEAVETHDCLYARDEVKTAVYSWIPGPLEDFEGKTDAEFQALIEAGKPDIYPAGWAAGLWEGCPAGGTYGVYCYEDKPSPDGTRHWRLSITCSIHTPESHKKYLAERPE